MWMSLVMPKKNFNMSMSQVRLSKFVQGVGEFNDVQAMQ